MYQQLLKVLSFCLFLVVLFLFPCVHCTFQCSIALGDKNLTRFPSNVLAVLNCTFNGHSADAIQWTLNGQRIEDEHILVDPKGNNKWSAVVLTNMTYVKDPGKFECIAKRGQEVSSCSVHPTKPKVQMFESVRIVDYTNTPQLECRAYGWPVPRVSWWINGSKVHDKDKGYTYLLDDFGVTNILVLKILHVDEKHQYANFTCRADNVFGTSVQNLKILVRRTDMIEDGFREKLPISAVMGTNTTLQCICSRKECKDDTTLSYWKYNGSIVNGSLKFRLFRKVSKNGLRIAVTILNVSQADEGDYICGISNSFGFEERRRTLQVLTKDDFQISTNPAEVSVLERSLARLNCRVTYPADLPEPETFWIFNNTRIQDQSQHYHTKKYGPLKGANSTEMVPFVLQISNVSAHDVGWYTCAADFKIILVEARISFILKEEPPKDEVENAMDDSNESPLVAISSITAGGIIMGFFAALVAYRLCRNKRSVEEPFFDTPVNGRQFRYDVFVTFSSQDLNWVKKELLPLLDKHKLKYCIHDRDFEIGKPVVDNMAESVYTSRKVLAVMSHNYMSSKFCRGELEMALYRSTEMGDSSVIVMRIDGVDRSKLPKALRNRTFLDHHDFTERKTWEERLIKHLKPPQLDKSSEKKNSEKTYSLLHNTEV